LPNWKQKLKSLGKMEKTFAIVLAVYLLFAFAAPGREITGLVQLVCLIAGLILLFRYARKWIRKAIWGLRNRLLVAYAFIAVVPVFLIIVLACLGGYAMISQLAVYLAVSDLNRRTASLREIAETLVSIPGPIHPEILQRLVEIQSRRLPQLGLDVKIGNSEQRWPESGDIAAPPAGWDQVDGVVARNGHYLLWSHARNVNREVTVWLPLSRRYLSAMTPGLGDVSLLDLTNEKSRLVVNGPDGKVTHVRSSHEPPSAPLPQPYNRFDIDVQWFSTVSVWQWDTPGKKDVTLLFVHTRPSAVLSTIFNAKVDQLGDLLPIILMGVSILFLIVEIVALVIGVSLTRTITRAVHNLYAGTQRVIQGDFSTRIQVYGKDQLAALSTSFNTMTENLERLLAVAKEKERLQAELEIARQVQEQLYPKITPALRTLRLTAICEPARMVSGDYYDYLSLPDGRLALAIGDVAGKGISAALLMAHIQAAMRMELRTVRAIAAPGSATEVIQLPTSRLVSDLNQQLHATTSPEKYATFFFALYNEDNGELKYTNAGHLPPLLVRNGEAVRLELSGTVVGAFPFAKYEENRIQMLSGDLLVCYTDGITEPENEYGEEFGEARLIDLIAKNSDHDESKIVSIILEAVRQWSSAPEQPDDMTLLLARKL
jgi:sigma-B regulation protein RsbU (phosphoserine phosphatase)